MIRALYALLFMACCFDIAAAQEFEDWIERSANPEEVQAWLDDLRRNPLDLNLASEAQIAALPFLDKTSARAIADERLNHYGFRSMDEVLSLPFLSPEQTNSIRQLASVNARGGTRVYSYASAGADNAPWADGALRNSWGKYRADFRRADGYSGYVYARRRAGGADLFENTAAGLQFAPHPYVPQVVIGGYQLEAGTGLVFASAYGMAHGLSAPDAVKPGHAKGLALRPSSDARSLYRGAAMTGVLRPVSVTLLGSWNRMDGAVWEGSAAKITEGEVGSQELDRARRDQIEERLAGVSVQCDSRFGSVGVNGMQSHYSPAFQSNTASQFQGSALNTGSVFANASLEGLSAVAELAASDPGGRAFQGALSASRSGTGMSIYYVDAAENFCSPHSKVWGGFGADAANQRTAGVKLQTSWARHTLLLNAQVGSTPSATATAPLGGESSEIEGRWRTSLWEPLQVELLGGQSWRSETSSTLPATNVQTEKGRVEIRWQGSEEYRIRFEIRNTRTEGQPSRLGTLLFFQTKANVLSSDVFARLTFFGLSSESGAALFQVFENGLIGAYPLAALSGSGRRAAVMISHHWSGCEISGKVAHTSSYSSGKDHSATEVAIGLSYRR